MNTFVKIRVYCEPLKGTPTEGEELIKYHAELKEQYKLRIQRQLSGEGVAKAKPWAQGSRPTAITKEGINIIIMLVLLVLLVLLSSKSSQRKEEEAISTRPSYQD
jgi:hypothetical protein